MLFKVAVAVLSFEITYLTAALGQRTLRTLIGYENNKFFSKFQIFH